MVAPGPIVCFSIYMVRLVRPPARDLWKIKRDEKKHQTTLQYLLGVLNQDGSHLCRTLTGFLVKRESAERYECRRMDYAPAFTSHSGFL